MAMEMPQIKPYIAQIKKSRAIMHKHSKAVNMQIGDGISPIVILPPSV